MPTTTRMMTEESAKVVDDLLGEFLLDRVGVNDMAIVSGMITAAAVIIATHCQRTREDPREMAKMARNLFDAAMDVMCERAGLT